MVVGRQDLRQSSLRLALVAGGIMLAVLAPASSSVLEQILGEPEGPRDWLRLLDDRPHSQMPPWLIGSTGSALLVLGLSLVLADRLGRLVWPLVAAGQLALTLYVAHILAFHWFGSTLRSQQVADGLTVVAAALAAGVLFAVLWRSRLPRGPLESLMAMPTIVRRWRRARQKDRARG